MRRKTVIDVKDLSLVFQTNDGPVNALSNIDLAVNSGEFVSFIGPSGCGKTTLLRVIADLEQPTSGSISVNGMTPSQAREKRAYGYVFQAAALYPWRTIGGNISLPLEVMGISQGGAQGADSQESRSWLIWQVLTRSFHGNYQAVCSNAHPLPAPCLLIPICF